MAHQRVEDQHYREMVELGQQNAALIPRVQRWCDHLKVRMVSSGLLAQATGLPIGRMAIECEHATGMSVQAMQFDQVAACFITENCRGCPHQQELNEDNAGREILQAADKVQEEEKKPKTATPAARRVRGLVSGDLSTAMATAPTTEQSVLECVARLELPDQAAEAAQLLCQAAELAPEFFNDLACEVIAEHFPELFHGGACVTALRIIGRKRKQIPAVAVRAAQHCVESQLCPDEALELLADYYEAGGDLPRAPTVARLVRHHGYRSVGSIQSVPEANPGQVRALLAIGKRDLGLLADAINRILEEREPAVRIAGPIAISAVLGDLPALGPLVIDRLTRSLELDDSRDHYGSVDVYACDALADIFALSPQQTRLDLDAAAAAASEEGKELLMKVYERLGRDAGEKEPPGPHRDRAAAAIPAAINALLAALMDGKRSLAVREIAAETLSHFGWDQPALILPHLDAILGILALILDEQVKFEDSNPGGNPLLPGLPREEYLKFTSISTRLFETIERQISTSPEEVFNAVVQMLRTLSSKQPAQDALKWHLVGLFERLSRDMKMGPKVVPPLYNALMDVDSVQVRARALSVIESMLSGTPELVPDNMREMVILYLTDSYVMIHRAAAKAARWLPPPSIEKAEEMLQALHAQFSIYHKKKEDHPHLDELAKSAAAICKHYPQLFPSHAAPLLVSQARSKNAHHARNALEEWKRYAPKTSAGERLYVREALGHFVRCPTDRDDWRPYDPAHRLFLSLFEANTPAIVDNLTGIQEVVAALAKDSTFQAVQFVALLLYHEQYSAATAAAKTISQSLPLGARHDALREWVQLYHAVAGAEAAVATGKFQEALAKLMAEERRLQNNVPNEDRNDPTAFIRSLSVADKVAKRLRGI